MPTLLLILLTIALLGGNVLRWQFSGGYAVSLFDLIVTLSALWILIIRWKTIIHHTLFKPTILFLGMLIVSLLFHVTRYSLSELMLAGSYTLRLSFLLLFIFLQRNKRQDVFLHVMGVGTIFLSLIQYFFYPSLRNLYYLGWDEHLYRAFGQFLDPNFLGIFLGMYLLFVVYQLLANKSSMFFLLTSLSLTITTLFLTYSRESYIVALLGLIAFAMMKKLLTFKFFGTSLIICLVLFTGYTLFAHKSEGTKLFRTASITQRLASDQQSLLVFAQNPLIGVGFNAYAFARPHLPFAPQNTLYANHAAASPDSTYLLILATTGVVGFGVFLYFLYCLVAYRRDAFGISVSILFLTSGFFINSLFYPLLFVWYLLLIRE